MQQLKTSDYIAVLQELELSPELTDEFIKLLGSGQTASAAGILRRHKQKLLFILHEAGHKVDLLDFLLYQIKNTPSGDNNLRKDDG